MSERRYVKKDYEGSLNILVAHKHNIQQALVRTEGVKTEACVLLCVSRRTLIRMFQRHNLEHFVKSLKNKL